MCRFGSVFLVVSVVLLIGAAPAGAATGGGGPGTTLFSDSSICSASGSGQVCTDTNLNVFPNGDGTESACVDIFTYAISSTGRSRVISDESGCNLAGTLTVGTDLSVTLASTDVGLFTCGRRSCSPSRTVSVSASDSPTSPVVTTTTKSTTTVGGCTYRTSTEEQDADVAGTLTIDSSTLDETGFVIVVSQRSTVHCH